MSCNRSPPLGSFIFCYLHNFLSHFPLFHFPLFHAIHFISHGSDWMLPCHVKVKRNVKTLKNPIDDKKIQLLKSSFPRWLAATPPLPASLPFVGLLTPSRARLRPPHVRQAQDPQGPQTEVGQPLRDRPCPREEARPRQPHDRHPPDQPGDHHQHPPQRQERPRPRRRLQREICE